MNDERFDETRGVRLRPSGVGRFFAAGFLLFWLCGWAVGEGFVIWFLLRAAEELLEGQLPLTGTTVALGAFLLTWLTFWTIGGIAAMHELLRSLWAEDSLVAEPPGLRVVRRVGPFRSRRVLRRDAIRRIRVLPGTTALVAETVDGTVELSTQGTLREREDAVRILGTTLGIESFDMAHDVAHPTSLPQGWSEVIDQGGGIAIVPDPAIRRKQAIFVSVLAMVAGLGTLLLIDRAILNPNLLAPTLLVASATAGLLAGAVWLTRGRREWRVETGRLILRRRFGRGVCDLFEGVALELSLSTDSDGDHWYELDAIAPEAPANPIRGRRVNGRRQVTRAIHDPHVPRQMGWWLSARAGIPLRDRTRSEEREADFAAIRRQLEESGRFGKLAGRWIDRMAARRSGPGSRAH